VAWWALFSADAWNNVTFAAAEVRDPGRTVPRALVLGTVVVTAVYLVTNVGYLNALAPDAVAHAPQDRVATALMEAVMGRPAPPSWPRSSWCPRSGA